MHKLAILLFAAAPLAAHATVTEVPRADPTQLSELTVSGGAELNLGFFPQVTLTAVRDQAVVFELTGGGSSTSGGGQNLIGSFLGGWNCRLLGREAPRQALALDFRAMAGLAMLYFTGGGGWGGNLGLFGPAVAGELSGTTWLNSNVGLSVGIMAGATLAGFVFPFPMARATVGLTF